MIAETGVDMSRFPTAEQLCAWAGVAPANHESAGKRDPAGTRHGTRWLRVALIEAAQAASRSNGSFLAAHYPASLAAEARTKPPSPSPTASSPSCGT